MFARNSVSASCDASDSFGCEVAEHVQLRVVGVGRVQVVLVVAAPEEGLAALDALDVVGVDAAVVEHPVLLVAEVVAHRPDHAHVGEEARGQREVHGGAAEHALALPERRLDRVEGDRSDHDEAHGPRQTSLAACRACAPCRSRSSAGPEVLEVVDELPTPEPGDGRGADRGRARGHQLRRHPPAREHLPREVRAAAGAGRRGGRARREDGRRAWSRCSHQRRLRGVRRGAARPRSSRSRTALDDERGARAAVQGLTAWHLYRTAAQAPPRARAWWCTRRAGGVGQPGRAAGASRSAPAG